VPRRTWAWPARPTRGEAAHPGSAAAHAGSTAARPGYPVPVTTYLWVAGLVLLGILAVVARERFYSSHGRRYGGWQPFWKRMWAPPGSPQSGRPIPSAFRADPDPAVERARWIYLAAAAVSIVYGAWGMLNGGFSR